MGKNKNNNMKLLKLGVKTLLPVLGAVCYLYAANVDPVKMKTDQVREEMEEKVKQGLYVRKGDLLDAFIENTEKKLRREIEQTVREELREKEERDKEKREEEKRDEEFVSI